MILWVLQIQAPGSIWVPRLPEVERHRKVWTYWNSVPAAQESRAPSPGLLGRRDGGDSLQRAGQAFPASFRVP